MIEQQAAEFVSHDRVWTGLNTADKAARVLQCGFGLITVLTGTRQAQLAGVTVNLARVAAAAGATRAVIGGLKFPRDIGWLLRKDEHGHRLFFKSHQDGVADYNKGPLGKQIPLFVCHVVSFWAFFGPKTPFLQRVSGHCRLIGLSAQFFDQVTRKYETHHWYGSEEEVPPELRPASGAGNYLGTGLDLAYALTEVTLNDFAPEWLAMVFGVASGAHWLAHVWTPEMPCGSG